MQAIRLEPDTPRSFHSEQEARFASAAWKSQAVGPGAFQLRVLEQRSSESVAGAKREPMIKRWLIDALELVDRINEEAAEEGYPPIGDVAKKNAKRVLFTAGSGPLEPVVYASMDGEIAVYFKSPVAPAALLVLLDDHGGAGCYWSLRGKSEYRRHDKASDLPDGFMLTQLNALGGSSLSQSIE